MRSSLKCAARMRGRCRLSLALVAFCWLALCSPSLAYRFGANVTPTGPEKTVFKWSTDACEPVDIPDVAARAFRDSAGRVQLLASHYVTRRMVGPDLNSVTHECPVLLGSAFNPDPSAFDDRQWLASPFTLDGQKIYALLHLEYQGKLWPGMCDPNLTDSAGQRCQYNAIGFATSNDGGASYTRTSPPSDLVASVPYRYPADAGPAGMFEPSNIVFRPSDGYYYVLVRTEPYEAQAGGSCLLRTQKLSDPSSWRAWDGHGFSVRFINPYVESPAQPAAHVCRPVSPDAIGMMTSSLTYNTYFRKFLLVGISSTLNRKTDRTVNGFFYSLSSDLINWSPQRVVLRAEFPWTHECGEPSPVRQPSILDPNSPDRNFGTSGQRVSLYFIRSNLVYDSNGCRETLDRDLVRIPIEFSGGPPQNDPICSSVTATPDAIWPPNHKLVPVTLSGASDPDGDPTTITITGVTQNAPTGGEPDAVPRPNAGEVSLRADRDGANGGRLYRIAFTASDDRGGTCSGTRVVGVSQGGASAADAGPSYDSFGSS
jgi:hypothetical protein